MVLRTVRNVTVRFPLEPNRVGRMSVVTSPLRMGHLFVVWFWLLVSLCSWPSTLFEWSKRKYLIILHNTVAVYLIPHVNTCITKAMTDTFVLRALLSGPQWKIKSYLYQLGQICMEWNGWVTRMVRPDGKKAHTDLNEKFRQNMKSSLAKTDNSIFVYFQK